MCRLANGGVRRGSLEPCSIPRPFRAGAHSRGSTVRKGRVARTFRTVDFPMPRYWTEARDLRLRAEAARTGGVVTTCRPPYMRVLEAGDRDRAAKGPPDALGPERLPGGAAHRRPHARRAPAAAAVPHGDAGLRRGRPARRTFAPARRAAAAASSCRPAARAGRAGRRGSTGSTSPACDVTRRAGPAGHHPLRHDRPPGPDPRSGAPSSGAVQEAVRQAPHVPRAGSSRRSTATAAAAARRVSSACWSSGSTTCDPRPERSLRHWVRQARPAPSPSFNAEVGPWRRGRPVATRAARRRGQRLRRPRVPLEPRPRSPQGAVSLHAPGPRRPRRFTALQAIDEPALVIAADLAPALAVQKR